MHENIKDSKLQNHRTRSKHVARTVRHWKSHKTWGNVTPSPAPNPLLVHFAVEIDLESLNILTSIIPGALRAFSLADFGLTSDLRSSQWQYWLFTDAAYVHTAVAISLVIRDFLLKRETSKITSFHLRKAIHQLNKNLSDEKLSVSDVTVAVVMILGLASGISNDLVAISAHATGLREIVRRRGGLDSFFNNPQLQIGMARIDLCLSLISGQRPIFTTGPSSWANHTDTSPAPSPCSPYPHIPGPKQPINDLVDTRIAAIFRNLQNITRTINHATSSKHMIQSSKLHAGVLTAQYQLLGLESKRHDVLSECVRVTLLAFLTTTFQILGSRIKYKHITNQLRELCQAIEVSTEQLREVMFWVLMMGAVALFDSDEPWLRDKWRADVLPLTRGWQWTNAERLLKKFVWIDAINEKAGKDVFEKMR
ncbi:hypothetical protein N431DRAFT_394076 [Stipitochalara longipes BDJ]|nr:hypothetical protein N431DRAFT_394076 [Stipitochalara longipes BDJ]